MAETTSANYPAALANSTSLLGDHSNQLSLTLGATCLIGATVITTTGSITTGAGGVNAPGYCLIDSEIIHFTGVSGATLTGCTRPANAAGGGAAAEHANGTTVYFVPVANWANQVKDEIIATQTELGTDPAGAFTDVDTSLNTWLLGVTNGITAGTTQTISGATALTKGINRVSTVANTGDAVALPTAVAGLEILIINDGANTMKVFPCNGESDAIDGGSVNAVDTNQIIAASSRRYIAVDGTNWYTASPAAGDMSDLVDDSTPQLGGFLDANGKYMQTEKGGDISSASPLVIDTDGDYFDVTGTTNFSVMTVAADRQFTLQFDGALTMTHHATNIDLPGAANITTAAGDVGVFQSTGANTVQCISYTKADGTAVVSAGGLFASYAIIADQKAANGASGTFTQDAWRTRDLNDEITDPDGIVSISSNQFTLAAGSYMIRWSAPAYQVTTHQTKLLDVTATADIEFGTAEFAEDDSGGQTVSRSFGAARVTPSGSNVYEIQHYCANTTSGSGFGERNNFGNVLYYTLVEIYKES